MRLIGSIGCIIANLASATLLCSPTLAIEAGGDVSGFWLTEERDAVVELNPCGARLCAHLYALHDLNVPANATDQRNERPELRNRPICNLQIMGELQRQPDNSWGNGWVYDPKVGKRYSVELRLKDSNTLLVHGYVGFKLAGKTATWTRTSEAHRCVASRS
jgi:uncharacterized protein (DUF2147 family)